MNGIGWRVNGNDYVLNDNLMRNLSGHTFDDPGNIVISVPMNNTSQYVCAASEITGDPYNIFVAGEYMYMNCCFY